MLFRLTPADFDSEQQKFSDRPRTSDALPRVTLNDLTPGEWTIVTMARESAGPHGCRLPDDSPLARQCSAPEPKSREDAFKTAPRAATPKQSGG